jgi:hypothetical protein
LPAQIVNDIFRPSYVAQNFLSIGNYDCFFNYFGAGVVALTYIILTYNIMKPSRLMAAGIFLALLVPQLALACGMAIEGDMSGNGWQYAMPTEAQGFVSYENGIEKMVMSHRIDAVSKDLAIIVPIPGDPAGIKLDILGELPKLNGQTTSEKAKTVAPFVGSVVGGSQLWTIVPEVMSIISQAAQQADTPGDTRDPLMTIGSSAASSPMTPPDVVVFNALEKKGIKSEVVTARTSQGLYDYLRGKGLSVADGSINVLNNYIGKNFSFVVSWVTHTNSTCIDQCPSKGIFVSFPTQDLYYPLIPTSAYSDMSHPETIRVLGYVTPKLYDSIRDYATVTYHEDADYSSEFHSADAQKLLDPAEGGIVRYTDITLRAPAKAYVQDLAILRHASLHQLYAGLVADYPILYGIILLAFASVLASAAAGMVWYEEGRTNGGGLRFAKLGLFNCLTIIGLIFASKFMLIPDARTTDASLMKAERMRRVGFLLSFTLFFSLLVLIISRIVAATV